MLHVSLGSLRAPARPLGPSFRRIRLKLAVSLRQHTLRCTLQCCWLLLFSERLFAGNAQGTIHNSDGTGRCCEKLGDPPRCCRDADGSTSTAHTRGSVRRRSLALIVPVHVVASCSQNRRSMAPESENRAGSLGLHSARGNATSHDCLRCMHQQLNQKRSFGPLGNHDPDVGWSECK